MAEPARELMDALGGIIRVRLDENELRKKLGNVSQGQLDIVVCEELRRAGVPIFFNGEWIEYMNYGQLSINELPGGIVEFVWEPVRDEPLTVGVDMGRKTS